MKIGAWRSQVARWFWELKVIGSNPISPRVEKMECGLMVGQLFLVQSSVGSNPTTPVWEE